MAEFKKNNRFSGGGSRRPFTGNRPSSGPRDFAQKEMFDAECNKCHDRCQVPFRPNGKKPVYCAKCFTPTDDRGGRDDRSARPSYGPSRDFGSSRPSMTTPSEGVADRQIQLLTKQIETMNVTIEKLVVAVDTFNRATALTKEIRKHFPADKPAAAPARASTKTEVKKATKKAVVKSAPKTIKKGT